MCAVQKSSKSITLRSLKNTTITRLLMSAMDDLVIMNFKVMQKEEQRLFFLNGSHNYIAIATRSSL